MISFGTLLCSAIVAFSAFSWTFMLVGNNVQREDRIPFKKPIEGIWDQERVRAGVMLGLVSFLFSLIHFDTMDKHQQYIDGDLDIEDDTDSEYSEDDDNDKDEDICEPTNINQYCERNTLFGIHKYARTDTYVAEMDKYISNWVSPEPVPWMREHFLKVFRKLVPFLGSPLPPFRFIVQTLSVHLQFDPIFKVKTTERSSVHDSPYQQRIQHDCEEKIARAISLAKL